MPDYKDTDSLLGYADVLFGVELAKELAKAYAAGFRHGLAEGKRAGRLLSDTMEPLAHCMFHDE